MARFCTIADHLGSPKELINQNGKVAWKATLDMYGMVRSQAGGTTTDSKCNFRFPGQYEDEETGLCYNRFRYYMPSEGMYTQRDPIGLAGGNPTIYGYTWNSLTQVDPFGLFEIFSNGLLGTYRILSRLRSGGQAHHLNQQAAFGSAIPGLRRHGQCVILRGNILTDAGSPHWLAHNHMENFWDLYRFGGIFEGDKPTNARYSEVLAESLRVAGLSEDVVQVAVENARKERIANGLLDEHSVPNVPRRRINLACAP